MTRKTNVVYLNILIPFIFCAAWHLIISFGSIQQENNAPVVKIINPKNGTPFTWGSQVNYEISVADKEDGDTRYDEINAKEVLLEVRYVTGNSKAQAAIKAAAQPDQPGFAVLRASNCFNCHNFNSKAIGPSLNEIALKYSLTAANVDLLVKRIKNGSTGVWGKETMPTHPELSADEIKNTVQWILKNAKDASVNYYIGTTGLLRTGPQAAGKKGVYVLIASYLDHGLKNSPAKHLKGQDAVVLN